MQTKLSNKIHCKVELKFHTKTLVGSFQQHLFLDCRNLKTGSDYLFKKVINKLENTYPR